MDFPRSNELPYTSFFTISYRIIESKRIFSSICEDLVLLCVYDANKEAENWKINSMPFFPDRKMSQDLIEKIQTFPRRVLW